MAFFSPEAINYLPQRKVNQQGRTLFPYWKQELQIFDKLIKLDWRKIYIPCVSLV